MMLIDVSELFKGGFLVGGTLSILSFVISYGIHSLLSTFKHINKF